MRVAVLCEFSGTVRDAFIRRGHDAVSCDLLPTEAPGPHIEGDCLAQDWSGFDLVIAHPPCTRLCNSGVRWLAERDLWADMRTAATFFRSCMSQGRRNVCENPVMHKYAREIVGRGPDQTFQPWQFGHGESKRTCLWLRNVPPLVVDEAPLYVTANVVSGREHRLHRLPPSATRWKERSKTYQGIADAMAEQWGTL